MKYSKFYLCILIFSFASCLSQRKTDDQLVNIIDNYISEFSLLNSEKLKAVLIYKVDQEKIKIIDVPKLTTMSFLRQEKYDVKNYSKILCFYNSNEINLSSNLFCKVPQRLKRKTNRRIRTKIKIFNTKIEFSSENMEWHSSLEIIYQLNENTFSREILK